MCWQRRYAEEASREVGEWGGMCRGDWCSGDARCRRGRHRDRVIPAGVRHASRPAFYFVVSAPGTVTIRVNATVAEPVSVTLYAGDTAIERAQGEKESA